MVEFTPFASGSRGNCYHITDGSTPLLLECGIGRKEIQRKLEFKVSDIVGCLISHEHGDHSKAVQDMMKAGVDCYMSRGTAEALNISSHRVHIVESKQQFKVGTWTILPFNTQHDAQEPLGFLLVNRVGEKCLYITDSYYCKYRFNDLNYIMVECNYSIDILNENIRTGKVHPAQKNRILKSHFSLENVKDFLQSNDLSQVREIWLLHLSDGNSDAARFKREIQELTGKMVFVPTQLR